MIREIDTLGRFGGDEFVIVLPETTRTAAEWVAERLRKKVAETPFYTDVDVISITISVGVTELTPDISDFEELVARADAAQYDAKLTGKNSVGSR
jgi:diguanylate cyclase (GGDEF)-like protein